MVEIIEQVTINYLKNTVEVIAGGEFHFFSIKEYERMIRGARLKDKNYTYAILVFEKNRFLIFE